MLSDLACGFFGCGIHVIFSFFLNSGPSRELFSHNPTSMARGNCCPGGPLVGICLTRGDDSICVIVDLNKNRSRLSL